MFDAPKRLFHVFFIRYAISHVPGRPLFVCCSRAGATELGVTMAVIPWVACNPSTSPAADAPGASAASHQNTANHAKKPLFLFLEGIDVNSPGGGHGSIIPRGGGETSDAPVAKSIRRGKEGGERSSHGRRRSDGSMFSSSSSGAPTPAPPRPSPPRRPLHSWDSSLGSRGARRASAPQTGTPAAAVLSHRPLEVVVYASLSFRNLLPVEVGWRVVGARGDAGAKVAEGSLGPGEGVHVLEANAMAMTPSLSFKVYDIHIHIYTYDFYPHGVVFRGLLVSVVLPKNALCLFCFISCLFFCLVFRGELLHFFITPWIQKKTMWIM